ncbi:hypothetical protein E2C01_082658 [Portunus trituberculatus]|uniref:Uncharacterized protein n=1 Tax=Portunus trituberculatus TaxID=210409 RepID=A0A5B7IZ18_PORTR|nr:hypothetical protein [Portunus trituberculatus]
MLPAHCAQCATPKLSGRSSPGSFRGAWCLWPKEAPVRGGSADTFSQGCAPPHVLPELLEVQRDGAHGCGLPTAQGSCHAVGKCSRAEHRTCGSVVFPSGA